MRIRNMIGIAAMVGMPGLGMAQTVSYTTGESSWGGDGLGFVSPVATSFELGQSMTITDVSIPVFYWNYGNDPYDGFRGAFNWAFYATAANGVGAPGTMISDGTVVPAFDEGDGVQGSFDVALAGPTLNANTVYWLSLQNTGPNPIPLYSDVYWRENWCSPQADYAINGNQWGAPNCNADGDPSSGLTATLSGTVVTTTPEPSSLALLGTGLLGLVPMVRRRS